MGFRFLQSPLRPLSIYLRRAPKRTVETFVAEPRVLYLRSNTLFCLELETYHEADENDVHKLFKTVVTACQGQMRQDSMAQYIGLLPKLAFFSVVSEMAAVISHRAPVRFVVGSLLEVSQTT